MSYSRSRERGTDERGEDIGDQADPNEPYPHSPSSIAKNLTTHVTYGKKDRQTRSPQTAGQSGDATIARKSTSTTDEWFKAKAKVRAGNAMKELDVYNDIEGAHRGQGRAFKPSRTPKRPLPQTLPKKTVDPLKNQNTQKISAPKVSRKSSGFFKQFHGPKRRFPVEDQEKEADSMKADGVRKEDKIVLDQYVLAAEEEWDDNVDEYEVPESEDETANSKSSKRRKVSTTLQVNGNAPWKGYVYGKPKKTIEDEIRELEEKARKTANDHDSEDELASNNTTARSSARKATPRMAAVKVRAETQPVLKPLEKATKPLDRRKAKAPIVKTDSPTLEDAMGVDDLEEEGSTNPAKAKAPRPTKIPKLATLQKSPGQPDSKTVVGGLYTFDVQDLNRIQQVLLEKVTGQRTIPLQNMDDQYAKVFSIVNQTVTAGESNSMLLIGARGSGKTAIINQVLREQTLKHADDFHTIRLTGFIHTDDKIALRDIWRQLGREMDLDENEANSKNYADTMSKLLALLSHPTETGTDATDQVTRSVIFILDEFELFAAHPRQTLLYNLFDIAQSRKAPIAVLGLTTRIDAAESLEKRVKSRFSHRYVHLSLPKSFQSFEQICKAALTVSYEDSIHEEEVPLEPSVGASHQATRDGAPAMSQWNTLVGQILSSHACSTYLRWLYYTAKSVPDFLATMRLALATIPTHPATNSSLLKHFSEALSRPALHPPDSRLTILATLGTLQLALLICAARLTNIYSTEIISFALVYQEYKDLASKARLQASASGLAQGAGSKLWGKEVAKGAWEELVDCGLILEDGRASGTGRVDVGLEEIGMSGVELGQWSRWCKEI